MEYPRITLRKGKEISLIRRHPWVFSGAIAMRDSQLTDGELVEVFDAGGKYLATGFFANGSIAVRVVSFKRRHIDALFWKDCLGNAWHYRQQLQILNDRTNGCRLFFGEGDGVPGMIIDYYDGHCVLQAHTPGVFLQRHEIANALKETLGHKLKSFLDKSAETLPSKHGPGTENSYLIGDDPGEISIVENGRRFLVDCGKGQKTGFFLDQRDNRQLLADYSHGKSVLNTFSYTGGFSVYAAAGGATRVVSVDVSAPAVEMCSRNMALNSFNNHEGVVADSFDYLKNAHNVFDLIVLDPPAFAKSRDAKHNAVIGYKRLNALAMKAIKKGGLLFTFSCSGVINRELFYNTITAAAIESGRNVRILKYLNQPADHPVTPFFAEGEYLKGLVLWVD